MNTSEKGWLKKYIDNRLQTFTDNYQSDGIMTDRERIVYRWIQPSGLFYGHAVSVPFMNPEKLLKLEDKDKMKLVLAESFLLTQYAVEEDSARLFKDIKFTPERIVQFYEVVFPDVKIRKKTWYGKQRPVEHIAEDIIGGRLKVKSKKGQSFWSRFFSNSLLFLDVYYFFLYLQRNDELDAQELRGELESIRFLIVRIIAAAAHANDTIEKGERELFNFFLASANLPKPKHDAALRVFNYGVNLEDLNFGQNYSWLIKKYVIELATLTIWSDKNLEDAEKDFLEELNRKFGFDEEELEASILSIESFVLNNWEDVHYLQSKQNYQMVAERMIGRLKSVIKKNKDSITTEIQESKELMGLLSKSKQEGLTPEEKEKVRTQLVDILKTLPTFVIIALPGSFLTLPILLKVLPKSAFPSAFSAEEI